MKGNQQDGYIPVFDDAGNITHFIDTETGEIDESVGVTVPRGSVLFTPKELEAMARKKEAYKQYKEVRDALKELGAFSFVSADNCFGELSPSHTIVLVYLSTYLKYGTDELWYKRRQMKTTDLEQVLDMSRAGAYKFLNAVRPEFLSIDDAGFIHLNQTVFKRGRGTEGKWFQRAYHECMRKLYLQTPVRRRKHLGYIFSMLPYLNIEYNVLCWNPFEQDIEYIKFMTLQEFCEIIGFDPKHMDELKDIYKMLEFENKHGIFEQFCAFVSHGSKSADNRIFVNPKIVYGGKNPESVKILGAFCSPCT